MRRRDSLVFAALVFAVLVVAGALAVHQGGPGDALPRGPEPLLEPAANGPVSASPASPTASSRAARRHTPKPRRASVPVRVQVPSIGIDAPLVPLGLDASGALEAPKTFTGAGWWSGGFRPGEPGPAVIAGHVDNKTGPAVFFRLRRLHRGDAILVIRHDGTRVHFTVERSGSYPKAHFPTRAVYGPTGRPALRLITCGGSFDFSTGHYLNNTVVYAGEAT